MIQYFPCRVAGFAGCQTAPGNCHVFLRECAAYISQMLSVSVPDLNAMRCLTDDLGLLIIYDNVWDDVWHGSSPANGLSTRNGHWPTTETRTNSLYRKGRGAPTDEKTGLARLNVVSALRTRGSSRKCEPLLRNTPGRSLPSPAPKQRQPNPAQRTTAWPGLAGGGMWSAGEERDRRSKDLGRAGFAQVAGFAGGGGGLPTPRVINSFSSSR